MRTGDGGCIAHFLLQCRCTNGVGICNRLLAFCCIDNQLDVFVLDSVDYMRPAFQHLVHYFTLDARCIQNLCSPPGGDQTESQVKQIASDPDNKLYRYNYGSLLLQAEDFGKAIENLTRAVELDPEYGNAFYNLGAAYVNQAVEFSEEINTIDDELRSNRDNMSAADISAREARMEELAEIRRVSFSEAIGPLERAKELTEAKGEDLTAICMALFSAYVQTDQEDMAKSVQSCAGYEDM